MEDKYKVNVNETVAALGHLEAFFDFCNSHDAAEVASGVRSCETAAAHSQASTVARWLDRFIMNIGPTTGDIDEA